MYLQKRELLALPLLPDVIVKDITVAPATVRAEEPQKQNTVYGRDLNSSDILALGGNKILSQIISKEYGIGINFSWKYPEVFSTTSKKIIIDDGQHQYFIKQKPKYCCNPYNLALSAQFQEFLAQKTDFVPRIIPTSCGDTYLRVGEAQYFTTEYIEGRMFNASTVDIENAGNALGIIHSLSEDFTFDDSRNLNACEDTIQFINLANQLPGAVDAPHREETIEALNNVVVKYGNQLDNDVKYIANHADYAPFNLVYDQSGKVIAVNDFDNVNFRPRTRDLAGAIVSFCDGLSYAGATSSLRKPIATTLNLEKVAAFVKGYTASAPALSEKEKKEYIGEACIRWVKIMSLGIVRGDFNYEEVLQAMPFIKFIEKELPTLV